MNDFDLPMTPSQPLPPGDSRTPAVKRRAGFDGHVYSYDLNVPAPGRSHGPETGTLAQYWRIVYRRKGALFLCVLLSTALGFLFTLAQTPLYRAKTLVEIESPNESFPKIGDVLQTSADSNNQSPEYNVRTQIAVLQSRPVLERMLQKNGLEQRLLSSGSRPNHFWSGRLAASVYEDPLKQHRRAVALATAALHVRPQPNTRLVEVTFDSSNPAIAAEMANSLLLAFGEVTHENRLRAIQKTSEWLAMQLQDTKAKLERSEDELQKYAHASDLTIVAGGENTTSEERLKQLQMELARAEADRVEKQSRYEQASKAPAESLPEVVDNPTLRDYQVQLTALRRQLADLSSSFTSNYPKVISLRSQIASLEAALEKARANVMVRTRNDYESAIRRENLVKTDYSGVIGLMSRESDKMNRYSFLKREVDTTRQLYEVMVQRVKEANLASAMKATDIHVVESALPPSVPFKPVAALNMGVGLLSGLCVGVAVIVQRARVNSNIQDPGDVALELNVPELGVIPAAAPKKFAGVRRLLGDSAVKASQQQSQAALRKRAPSVVTESFRLTLASILLSPNDGARPRVIAFTSASAKEGKTTVTSNLGIALAGFNRRVLLIDGDLRKRRLHRVFEVENNAGLYEALTGNTNPSVKESKIPNLFVLPSGRGIDGDMLFSSSKLRDLLEKLKADFDMILIDTPPLLQVADARLICSEADATVLVIAQHTPREVALLARQRLADDGSHLLGTILNKWDPKTSLKGYQNYHSYYKGYYAEDRA